MTLNRRLLKIFDPKVAASSKPKNGVASFDSAVDSSCNLWFCVHTSTTATKLPVVLYFHGGSYVFGGADSFGNDASCRHLSHQLSAVVVSVNYRLAPEHKFPSQLRDALDCLKFIEDRDRDRDHHNDDDLSFAGVSRCFIMGESAGGNNSAFQHHIRILY